MRKISRVSVISMEETEIKSGENPTNAAAAKPISGCHKEPKTARLIKNAKSAETARRMAWNNPDGRIRVAENGVNRRQKILISRSGTVDGIGRILPGPNDFQSDIVVSAGINHRCNAKIKRIGERH